MSRVITFSRYFPATHPKKGQPTFFVEQILKATRFNWFDDSYYKMLTIRNLGILESDISKFIQTFNDSETRLKHHTIRAGNRWKVGDKFSPRVWSGKPYASKMITITPDIEIKKIWNIEFKVCKFPFQHLAATINGKFPANDIISELAKNDGLSKDDLQDWFCPEGKKFIYGFPLFTGQIICWNDSIEY